MSFAQWPSSPCRHVFTVGLADRDIFTHIASGQTVKSHRWKLLGRLICTLCELQADPGRRFLQTDSFMQNKSTAGACLITVITNDFFFSLLFNFDEGKKTSKYRSQILNPSSKSNNFTFFCSHSTSSLPVARLTKGSWTGTT